MVADLSQRKGKISGCFKNSTSVVLQQCQVGNAHLSIKILLTLKELSKHFNTTPEPFLWNLFHFELLQNNRSAVFETTIRIRLSFVCHKSATTLQIDSYKVLNSKLRTDLCNCVKTEVIKSTAAPQQPNKRGTIFFETPCITLQVETTGTLE